MVNNTTCKSKRMETSPFTPPQKGEYVSGFHRKLLKKKRHVTEEHFLHVLSIVTKSQESRWEIRLGAMRSPRWKRKLQNHTTATRAIDLSWNNLHHTYFSSILGEIILGRGCKEVLNKMRLPHATTMQLAVKRRAMIKETTLYYTENQCIIHRRQWKNDLRFPIILQSCLLVKRWVFNCP